MNNPPSSRLHILLIEDNIHDQTAFRRALDRSRIPFALTLRERAEEIPDALEESDGPYDVVVVDYDLPGMNGLEAYQLLCHQPDMPPFVMLTGVGSEDLAVRALKAGMADYLIKDPNQGYRHLLPLKLRAVKRQYEDRRARRKAQAELEKAHADLERLVDQRTAELHQTVESLRREITERKQTEYALRRSERALRNLSRKIVDTQEKERRQIAKELHDSIGSSLAAIKYAVEGKLQSMHGQSPEDIISLETIVDFIHDTIEEVRRISSYLRPAMLDDTGLLPTMAWFCRTHQEVYRHIRIESHLDVDEGAIPESAKIVIYRIMQEAVNNALRHSGGDTISIRLDTTGDGTVRLCVADNGSGMDPLQVPSSPHGGDPPMNGLGLQTMRDRAQVIGATFTVDSCAGQGTRICMKLPAAADRQRL